jgi:hypothetical protein
MIETFQTDLRFDLVVMINVIQHCQDAEAVFGRVLEITLPGGLFVYWDKMYEPGEVKRLSSVIYDAGHTLRIVDSVVDDCLARNFEPLMQADYLVERDLRGVHLRNYDRHFVGRRLGPEPSVVAY